MVVTVHPVDAPCQDLRPTAPRSRQPWLHELEVAVRGPVTCLSLRDGDIDAARPGGEATGLFVDDRRVVHTLVVTLDGVPPQPVAAASTGGATQTLAVARHLGDPGPDPTVEVARDRVLHDRGLTETVTVRNRWSEPVSSRVVVRLAGDGAELHDVKQGDAEPGHLPTTAHGEGAASWSDARHTVRVRGDGATLAATDSAVELAWDVTILPAGAATLVVDVTADRVAATPFDAEAGFAAASLDDIRVTAQDARLGRTVEAALDDLRHLTMRDPLAPDDVFAAAGTPWYLTLFGRDSLWSARLALPFGTDLARGTLRALARRQGTVDDVETAQAPGKIPHEVRRTPFATEGGAHLPAVYYGTVDATPLWICVLHDAWRWGLEPGVVRELAPALKAALAWMERAAADNPDGLLRYLDESGTGLTNQGWKDSGDSMRDASGAIAVGPIALVETQAYAVEAAHGAAALLEEVLGEDGSAWRAWGDALASRVRERFWVRSGGPALLAMALDGSGRPVDGLGSNIGHALATGLLDEAETRHVAHALSGPDLLGPLGISTLSRSNPAFNPIGYHTGSVWTHDSAIGALGLARTGNVDGAAAVARALVDVAAASDYRWPELYGAEPVLGRPAPYPASCRPQAWAAASAGALVSVLLGLRADVPAGRIHVSPLASAPFGALAVEGLKVGGHPLAVEVDARGDVVSVTAPEGIEVVVG